MPTIRAAVASVAVLSSSMINAPDRFAQQSGCQGRELGTLPLTVEMPRAGGYEDYADPEVLGVDASDEGVVFVNFAYSVYCIDDDKVFEVATPQSVPYPKGPQDSTYADIAVGPHGVPLLVDWQNPRVFELYDGALTVVPGSDDPAIGGSRSITASDDGTVYVTGLDDSGSQNVYAIADGKATLFAGPGSLGVAGDGGPATDSYLDEPEGIELDDAGNLYIADRRNSRIAVVAPDGTINTLSGGQGFDDRADSDALEGPDDVAVDPSGVVHVLDQGAVLRIEADGTSTALSASSNSCYPDIEDETADLCPLDKVETSGYRMAFDPSGAMWITSENQLLRVVDGRVRVAVEFELVSG